MSRADPRNVFVGGFPDSCREQDLEELFSKFGRVKSVRIIKDLHTGKSRGYAFVLFDTEEAAAEAARSMNNYDFEGRSLKVEAARGPREPPREREPREGGGYGYRGGRSPPRRGYSPPRGAVDHYRPTQRLLDHYGPPFGASRDRDRYDDRYYDDYDRRDRMMPPFPWMPMPMIPPSAAMERDRYLRPWDARDRERDRDYRGGYGRDRSPPGYGRDYRTGTYDRYYDPYYADPRYALHPPPRYDPRERERDRDRDRDRARSRSRSPGAYGRTSAAPNNDDKDARRGRSPSPDQERRRK